jgi:DnaK suppressor protein
VVDLVEAVVALKNERSKLVHQLEELGANEAGELTGQADFGDGFADAAAATAERSEVLGIVENIRDLLDEVDAAQVKVEEGTYGVCEHCHESIEPARMEYRPTSRFHVGCKPPRT